MQQGSPEFRRVTLALFLGALATYANIYTTQPLLPLLSEAFQTTPAIASLTLSVTSIGLAVSLLFTGPLADSLGRKAVMATSLVASGVIGVLAAFAPNFNGLLVLRALNGLAAAGLPATAMAYLGEEVDPRHLGVAMGLYVSGNSVGGLGGRIASGIVGDIWNWRAAVGVTGVIALVCSIWFWRTLPPSRNFRAQPLRLGRLVKSQLNCLRDPGLLALYTISFMVMGSSVAMFNYISYHLMAAPYHLSQTLLSWIFILYLVGTFSSTWLGRLSDTRGRKSMLFLGLTTQLAGALITLAASLPIKVFGLALFTFGYFGAHSIAAGWVGEYAKIDRGAASSLYLFFFYMGSSLGGTFGGTIWSAYGWPGVVTMISVFLGVAFGAGALVTRLMMRHEPGRNAL